MTLRTKELVLYVLIVNGMPCFAFNAVVGKVRKCTGIICVWVYVISLSLFLSIVYTCIYHLFTIYYLSISQLLPIFASIIYQLSIIYLSLIIYYIYCLLSIFLSTHHLSILSTYVFTHLPSSIFLYLLKCTLSPTRVEEFRGYSRHQAFLFAVRHRLSFQAIATYLCHHRCVKQIQNCEPTENIFAD